MGQSEKNFINFLKNIPAKKGAFTLVELLVVIAIVGLLSTIVLAVTSGVGEQGRIAKSLQFSQHLENTLGDHLVGRWTFDETPELCGANKVCDTSGWGNNGTIAGAIPDNNTPSGQGWAMSFDGVDDYVNCGNSNTLKLSSNGGTVSLWFKTSTIPDSFDYILSRDTNGYTIQMNADGTLKVYWAAISGSALFLGSTPTNLANGAWHHFAFTIPLDSHISEFYVDGSLIGTDAFGTLGDNGSNLYIGGLGAVRNWQGLIDEVRIYNTALTTSQIQSQYYAGLNRLLAKGLMDETEYQEHLTKN
jgi:prepilin-type N-terminal cleavage/methylation domain-containing protein